MDLKARLESTESRLVNVLKSGPKNDKNCDNFSQDIDTILKLSSRLQEMNNSNKSLKDENETLKEVCNTSDDCISLISFSCFKRLVLESFRTPSACVI